jgi:hypothetical protein
VTKIAAVPMAAAAISFDVTWLAAEKEEEEE